MGGNGVGGCRSNTPLGELRGAKMGQDGFKIVQDVSWKRFGKLCKFRCHFLGILEGFEVPLGAHFGRKKIILSDFWGIQVGVRFCIVFGSKI